MDNLDQIRNFGYRLKAGNSDRRVGSKVYVLGPDGAMHILENAVATFLWESICEGKLVNVDGLASLLEQHFRVEPEIARSDVAEFLVSLRDFDVLEQVSNPGAD